MFVRRLMGRSITVLALSCLSFACGGGRFGPASSQRPLLVPAGEHQVLAAAGGTKGTRDGAVGFSGGVSYRYGISDAWNLSLPLPALSRGLVLSPELSASMTFGLMGIGYALHPRTYRDPRYLDEAKEYIEWQPGLLTTGRLLLSPASALYASGMLKTTLATDGVRRGGGFLSLGGAVDLGSRLTLGLGVSVFGYASGSSGVSIGPGAMTPPLLAFHVMDGLDLTGNVCWTQNFHRDQRSTTMWLGIDWYWD